MLFLLACVLFGYSVLHKKIHENAIKKPTKIRLKSCFCGTFRHRAAYYIRRFKGLPAVVTRFLDSPCLRTVSGGGEKIFFSAIDNCRFCGGESVFFMVLEGIFSLLKNLIIYSAYVDNKSSFPKPLSKEKEAEYIKKVKEGDPEAKELLIRHNLRLVAHIAKKYGNYPDSDELISIGSIGLIKAINSFEPGKGTQLATYAARCIDNEILMTLRINKKHRNNLSLYEPVGVDKEGNEISFNDILTYSEDSVFEGVESKLIMERLTLLMKRVLEEREYDIIAGRYGLGETAALTQREVAEKYGISRSYISRIEKRALEKIRAEIEKDDLKFD